MSLDSWWDYSDGQWWTADGTKDAEGRFVWRVIDGSEVPPEVVAMWSGESMS